ncbi:MAG TPA: L-threonylcarbamoyladenylate synthase [Acidimicrobiales bacterium]|nr:L-threonylcarbamoyladenylate synthase [Acidimicrobiales bacterium]
MAVGSPPDAGAIARAVAALRSGAVIGLPTDTVYGLGAHPGVPGAVEEVFRLKGRPPEVAMPVLVAGADQLEGIVAEVPPSAAALMAAHWPGPLTVVLRRSPAFRADLGGEPTTVGVRAPDHPVVAALCRAAGPLAVTSANLHGRPPLPEAAEVARTFPTVLVLDGGRCEGLPSTVVDCTGPEPVVLRQGEVRLPRGPRRAP